MSLRSLFNPLAAAGLLAFAGASQAGLVVHTSLASFNAATSAQGTDDFTGFSITGNTPSPITRAAGAYTYRATAAHPFFGGGTTADPFLSTDIATDSILFNNFTGPVTAIGGNFFGSNLSGLFALGDIMLTATDNSGSSTQTIVNAAMSSFLGFVSDGTLVSLSVSSVQPAAGFLWPSVDNLVLAAGPAAPPPLPEPSTYALLLLSLAGMGFMRRRAAQQ